MEKPSDDGIAPIPVSSNTPPATSGILPVDEEEQEDDEELMTVARSDLLCWRYIKRPQYNE
jgi:hypothetical protein